jgi:intein/homing endonuclease
MVPEDTFIAVLSGDESTNMKISEVIDLFINQPQVDVMSHDGKKISASMVSNTRATDSRDFISIQFEQSRALVITPEHQIYITDNKQWKRANQLHAGEHVLDSSNTPKQITSVHTVKDNMSHKIYALAVTPDQNYFANDVLIHNES